MFEHNKYRLNLKDHFNKISEEDSKKINGMINKNLFGTVEDYQLLSKYSMINSSNE